MACMADVENFILEHLKALRGEFVALKADMAEVKMRLASLEERVALLEKASPISLKSNHCPWPDSYIFFPSSIRGWRIPP